MFLRDEKSQWLLLCLPAKTDASPSGGARRCESSLDSLQDMRLAQGLISYAHPHRVLIVLTHLLCCYVPLAQLPPHMGRPSTKSVARIYPDVNSKLGPSWYEYGLYPYPFFSHAHVLYGHVSDNLQVQWGSQDHYEIVRKVGRGKYSEVRRSTRTP